MTGPDKPTLRQRVWDDLEDAGVARFPFPPHGRIPNFAGADDAAERLAATSAWADANVIKANPDAPQLPVRRRALREDKTVYMAVPRLRDPDCFVELDPAELADLDAAPTVSGMADHGVAVPPEALPPVDLIVAGSVAVTDSGARVGKGEGYSDLEYAVLATFDRVGPGTPVGTTVHERQVVEDAPTPAAHDVPIDLVVTPERTVETDTPYERPTGIDWSRLDDDRIDEVPVLDRLRDGG